MSLLIIWSKGDNYNVYANIRAQDINEGNISMNIGLNSQTGQIIVYH